jgi:hypothetical protein
MYFISADEQIFEQIVWMLIVECRAFFCYACARVVNHKGKYLLR